MCHFDLDHMSDWVWRESNFLATTRPATALCVCVCSIICAWGSRIAITQSHTHTLQQTHTHKAETGRVVVKKLLSRRRQSDIWSRSKSGGIFYVKYAPGSYFNPHCYRSIFTKCISCRNARCNRISLIDILYYSEFHHIQCTTLPNPEDYKACNSSDAIGQLTLLQIFAVTAIASILSWNTWKIQDWH